MKVIVVAVAAVLALMSGTTSGFAQDGYGHDRAGDGHRRGMREHGPGDPMRMIERMSRHLDLDDLQREKVNNIMLAAQPELDALRDRARANREAQHALDQNASDYTAKLSDLAAESGEIVAARTMLIGGIRADVNGVLTEEQRAQLAKRGEHRQDRGEKRSKAQ